MTQLFGFIATKTSYANVVPQGPMSQGQFNRRVANAFAGNEGRLTQVGEILFFPISTPDMANVVLCDGKQLSSASFPELSDFLGTSQGVAAAGKFVLPNTTTFVFAPTVPVQTVDPAGTVITSKPVVEPTAAGATGGTTGGNVDSGGKPPYVDHLYVDKFNRVFGGTNER